MLISRIGEKTGNRSPLTEDYSKNSNLVKTFLVYELSIFFFNFVTRGLIFHLTPISMVWMNERNTYYSFWWPWWSLLSVLYPHWNITSLNLSDEIREFLKDFEDPVHVGKRKEKDDDRIRPPHSFDKIIFFPLQLSNHVAFQGFNLKISRDHATWKFIAYFNLRKFPLSLSLIGVFDATLCLNRPL